MFKFLYKRTVLIRILIIVLSAFLLVEFIQSYNYQIVTIFNDVNRLYNNNSRLKESPAPLNLPAQDEEAANDSVPLIDLKALPKCASTPEELFGNLSNYTNKINKTEIELDKLESLLSSLYELRVGGQWSPPDCQPAYRVAIIIPYRDRLANLKLFMLNMHPFFIRQKMSYGIYLIEPVKELKFNRGLLMNAGFKEALKDSFYLWDCFFFHDVDMIPEDMRNLYSCSKDIPKHYAVAVSKWKYRTNGYFSTYYGGINAFTREQYVQINGFSNNYFGWGGEDDDLRGRTVAVFKKFTKESAKINRYFMNSHTIQKANPNRTKTLYSQAPEYKKGEIKEGLSNVKYTVKRIEKTLLFTRILVDHPNKEFT